MCFSSCFSCCTHKSDSETLSGSKITVCFIGIDNAGKTTAFNTLRDDHTAIVVPTVGFDTSTINYGSNSVSLYDLGGGARIRDIWQYYFAQVHGVVFFIDSADSKRLEEAQKCLLDTIDNQYLKNKPLLILCNKADKDEALPIAKITRSLDLQVFETDFSIHGCISLPTDGKPHPLLTDAFDWIIKKINDDYSVLQ
ncbi:hypothetical protein GEMRC1_007071 [Eukaryota sp. GEM-RC1]